MPILSYLSNLGMGGGAAAQQTIIIVGGGVDKRKKRRKSNQEELVNLLDRITAPQVEFHEPSIQGRGASIGPAVAAILEEDDEEAILALA